MPPIVCVVGKSDMGKTTLVEGLVAELKRRRYRVATIKHDAHGFDIDLPGKDSWRHAQAGSDAVILSSPEKLALIKIVDHDSTLDEINQLIGMDYDIVLAEGFKQAKGTPKIEVHRKGMGEERLLCHQDELIAIATDEPLDMTVPQYPLGNFSDLSDLIEKRFLASQSKEWVTLFVNGAKVPLAAFVQGFIAKTLIGMISSLKGAKKPESLELSLRRKNGDR